MLFLSLFVLSACGTQVSESTKVEQDKAKTIDEEVLEVFPENRNEFQFDEETHQIFVPGRGTVTFPIPEDWTFKVIANAKGPFPQVLVLPPNPELDGGFDYKITWGLNEGESFSLEEVKEYAEIAGSSTNRPTKILNGKDITGYYFEVGEQEGPPPDFNKVYAIGAHFAIDDMMFGLNAFLPSGEEENIKEAIEMMNVIKYEPDSELSQTEREVLYLEEKGILEFYIPEGWTFTTQPVIDGIWKVDIKSPNNEVEMLTLVDTTLGDSGARSYIDDNVQTRLEGFIAFTAEKDPNKVDVKEWNGDWLEGNSFGPVDLDKETYDIPHNYAYHVAGFIEDVVVGSDFYYSDEASKEFKKALQIMGKIYLLDL